mmetsp:Transcript_13864/g.20680  ORF Transcript_13864/g.20680 Transcript_13864/m.20680 type:complete len:387 (+) Transcript_13864:53-1213(+)
MIVDNAVRNSFAIHSWTLLAVRASFQFQSAYAFVPIATTRAAILRGSLSTSPHSSSCLHSTIFTKDQQLVGERLDIDEIFFGDNIEAIHTDPDVFLIRNFLDTKYCDDLIEKASEKKLDQSPVVYAGKTDDMKELVSLAAKGPVVWLAVLVSYFQVSSNDSGGSGGGQLELLIHAAQNYAGFLLLALAGITAFLKSRENGLQELRTSTSTTLDDLDNGESGTYQFVKQSTNLFNPDSTAMKENPAKHAQYFEAPTVIRYEEGQALSPHFDANRSAETEDKNRGGQTLATLLLYLNNVDEGGQTRFGLLPPQNGERSNNDNNIALTVQPKAGDAVLFFPADKDGNFDERLEHEGCAALDTKWIARIWRHYERVPPPFGLTNSALSKL